MSVYQPAPGQNSTTVWPGFRPQNWSDSTGWRQRSRARSAGGRQDPATAASRVVGAVAAFEPPSLALQALSAAAQRNMARRENQTSGCAIRPRHAPQPSFGLGVARALRRVKGREHARLQGLEPKNRPPTSWPEGAGCPGLPGVARGLMARKDAP